jgi:hypothetical protein
MCSLDVQEEIEETKVQASEVNPVGQGHSNRRQTQVQALVQHNEAANDGV